MKEVNAMTLHTLMTIMPQWVKRMIPQVLKDRMKTQIYSASLPSYNYVRSLMSNYQVKNLVNVAPKSFKEKIDEFLQLRNHEMEGFKDPEKQRDMSIQFNWGHNHDFGEFHLRGAMGDRHISLLATFIDRFNIISHSLNGLKVLDIGCWTGGTSLLLCAMGAHVIAIEEVKKYVDCLNYLKYAFDIHELEPKNLSLYELSTPKFEDSFDIVLCAGVLYHVTDIILALRTTFNCLKDGGVCLLETAAVDSNERILSYRGPTIFAGGTKEDLTRSGWNWLIPSPTTLSQMMSDVGYTDVQVSEVMLGRAFAIGKRDTHVDIMRAGLSVRNIR